ncbi:MAG: hypothetical protein WAS07_00360 [Micropruina sp.]
MGFLLETTVAHDPLTPWFVGGTVLLMLLIALRVVHGMSKSRPHS